MCFTFLLTISILYPVIIEADDIFKFYQDIDLLSDCIKDYLLNSEDSYYKENRIAETIADLASQRFYDKALPVKIFE